MISFKQLSTLIFAAFSFANLCAQPENGVGTHAVTTSVHQFAPSSVLAEGRWVKIALDGKEDGVYEIPYSQLTKLGFQKPENVGVYGFGGHILDEAFSTGHIDDLPEVAVYHDKNQKRILFYGRGIVSWYYDTKKKTFKQRQNTYANRACYFLHEKDSAALAMEIIPSGEKSSVEVTSFDAHLLHEQDLVNIGKTGRELYGESFTYSASQLFSFDETLLPGSIHITANLAGLASDGGTFTVKHGEETVGTVSLRKATSSYVYATEATLDKTLTLQEEEKPSFRISYTAKGTSKLAHLNYIRLEGQQSLAIPSGKSFLLFRNLKANTLFVKYVLNRPNANCQVWDVTDPKNIRIQDWADETSFIPQEKGLKEYVFVDFNGKNFPGVSVIGNVRNQNLHATEDVDMIIVSASGLKTYAQQLADFRVSHDSLRVKVVTAEEIYNEYSSGTADATAIRLYMKNVFEGRNNNGFLLLFGDGHYDNRKIEGSPNYLVTYETEPSLVETSSTVCDDYFGFLDDNEGGRTDSDGRYSIKNDVVDIAIGRIPVHNTSDAEAVVKKIIEYSTNYHYGSWKNKLCFLSDDDKVESSATDTPNAHMSHNDKVIDVLQKEQGHNEFVYQKIYLPAYSQATTASGTDYPDAKKEFLETLQQGALLVNYAGHGANNSITHEMLMTTSRASQLNMKNLPLWVTASCDISRWDDDDDSMGEVLFTNHNGGAIALISTVRVVYASQNLSLNLAIAKCLFHRKPDGSRYRLGEMLKEAKQSLGSDYNKLNFCLLGDPSMILSYPEYEMEVTEVDYSDRVTIRGRVINPHTGETATDFNGLVYPTIFDAADSISADKGLWQEPLYWFTTRTKKIFSGRDVVRDGLFEFSFITPKDVTGGTNDGLINLYACDENNNEANGFYSSLTINRPVVSSSDTVGPEIRKAFINSPEFVNGGIVGKTPYFFAEVHDESGFNATGNRVGHDVTLTIHSTSNTMLADKQYNLNNYLTTYTGDPTTGNVRFTIPEIDNGEYDLTFKIWDSMNNSSSTKLHIVVNDREPHQPVLVQAFPSPVSQGQAVAFRVLHNLPESPTSVRLQVFTETGTLVHETTAATTSADVIYLNEGASELTDFNTSLNADESSSFFGASTINWRVNVSPGIYIYKVYLSSGNSESTSQSKLLMVKP